MMVYGSLQGWKLKQSGGAGAAMCWSTRSLASASADSGGPINFHRAQIHQAMLDRGTDGVRGELEL